MGFSRRVLVQAIVEPLPDEAMTELAGIAVAGFSTKVVDHSCQQEHAGAKVVGTRLVVELLERASGGER